MKVVFLGTPDFAVLSLKAIYESKHQVIAVVTQPDKPVGRKAEMQFSPVKQFAVEHKIKVLQYNKIRVEGVEDLIALKPDVMVTCAFGQILSQEIIDIAPHGVINVHASLLPKYRGASPIQSAVLNGESKTGVTIMKTEAGLDCGDIILTCETEILPNETSGELFDRLSPMGAKLVVEALDKIENGTATFTPQNESEATFVKMLKKSDAEIDFSKSKNEIHNFVRGNQPWPCAFTFLNDKLLKVYSITQAGAVHFDDNAKFGQVVFADKTNGLVVRVGDGLIKINELQLEGGKRMTANDFLLGRKIEVGVVLGKNN